MFETHESQLELFDVANAAPRPRREATGRVSLHLRYDQFILVGVAGLMVGTVVFACGIERGKQLARAERPLLPPPMTTEASKPAEPAATDTSAKARPKPETTPASAPKMKTPVRVASQAPAKTAKPAAATSHFAVQLASYSRPQLAKQELSRLQARGERAFLVIREGRTVMYAGPFPSKGHASAKVADLKRRYHDCFIRSL